MALALFSLPPSFHVNLNSYLKKRDFADDGVVDIYSDVQTHFIWQLSQQLLLIFEGRQ